MGGSSRLEKLLRLLECGTSDATRKAAAKQIVEITKSHPQQLPSVIRKVHQYLYSKGWDTRIAASETLGYLAEAFPHTSIQDLAARCAQLHGQQASASAAASPTMTFSTFSLQVLLDKGTALLACGGQEYDVTDEPGLTAKQRLERQRAQLKKRLGFESGGEDLGNQMDTDNLINDDDLDIEIKRTPSGLSGKGGAAAAGASAVPKQQPAELLQSMEGLSARERNQAKRRAKAMARGEGSGRGISAPKVPKGGSKGGAQGTSGAPADASSGAASAAAGGSSAGSQGRAPSAELAAEAAEADEAEWACAVGGAWPFQGLCDQLCVDVLDATWEVRHGAATALREVLRSGG